MSDKPLNTTADWLNLITTSAPNNASTSGSAVVPEPASAEAGAPATTDATELPFQLNLQDSIMFTERSEELFYLKESHEVNYLRSSSIFEKKALKILVF